MAAQRIFLDGDSLRNQLENGKECQYAEVEYKAQKIFQHQVLPAKGGKDSADLDGGTKLAVQSLTHSNLMAQPR
nr:hypothetical transcript [Hymenolepis microstoma]